MDKHSFWIVWVAGMLPAAALAQQDGKEPSRLDALERRLEELEDELAATQAVVRENEKKMQSGGDPEPRPVESSLDDETMLNSFLGRLVVTGYGEMHGNFSDGHGGDKFDIHRLVLGVGYQFASWISFSSEIEVEHAFVSSGSGGELIIEQAYLDLNLTNQINLRFGRILTPLGITNWRHEPPSFNGVERPAFDTHIIPSTWSSDGAGIYGNLLPGISYQLYVVAGLDGSKISSTGGIRSARIKERPSFNDVAVTGRVDVFPFATIDPGLGQTLRIGIASYWGRLDNGNNAGNPGLSGPEIQIYTADVNYTIWRFDLRGAVGYTRIDKARKIDFGNRVPSQTLGWYLEFAAHVLPDVWRVGVLSHSDLVFFVRYDDVNTQHRVPTGRAPDLTGHRRDPAGNRNEWTFGIGFYPVPNVVFKADYQIRDDETHFPTDDPSDLINVGVGFQF